jgi:hypothetical protein
MQKTTDGVDRVLWILSLCVVVLLVYKVVGGPNHALLPFMKAAGVMIVGAVCCFYICAQANSKVIADLATSIGFPLLAFAALAIFVGIILSKISNVLQQLQQTINI